MVSRIRKPHRLLRPTGGIGYAYDLGGNLSGAKSPPGGYDLSYDYDEKPGSRTILSL